MKPSRTRKETRGLFLPAHKTKLIKTQENPCLHEGSRDFLYPQGDFHPLMASMCWFGTMINSIKLKIKSRKIIYFTIIIITHIPTFINYDFQFSGRYFQG